MRRIVGYMGGQAGWIALSMSAKLLAAVGELLIPFVLEHIIDRVAPGGSMGTAALWGMVMVLLALAVRRCNLFANRTAVSVSSSCTLRLRQDLFVRTMSLSGAQADRFGLPSLISRMTSDSYNIQNFITSIQTVGVRAPILLVGGICVTLAMDRALASILCVMAPVLMGVVVAVSRRGVPLYGAVQRELDGMVRVMRENITGVRVVKALSKEERERRRFHDCNDRLTRSDLKASLVMAFPGPLVQLCLNVGLVLVVLLGARRVDSGAAEPGVILAFLTYFNLILHSVMSFNRIFLLLSKASASARRIEEVLDAGEELPVLPLTEERRRENGALLEFDRVSFTHQRGGAADAASFAGGERGKCLDGVSFRLGRGETLGVIGATGAGKSTILHLLLRFYDADEGGVYVDGRDVRTYDRAALRKKFGTVFQNDIIFAETLADNITLGRDLSREAVRQAAEDAMAAGFIAEKPGQYGYAADIRGANLSGGQKQRLLIARALAADPEILLLDDAASALDYRTDAALRRSLRERHGGAAAVIVAQRVSSILSADQILVLEEGRVIGQGRHEELLERCPAYREIYRVQMGEL